MRVRVLAAFQVEMAMSSQGCVHGHTADVRNGPGDGVWHKTRRGDRLHRRRGCGHQHGSSSRAADGCLGMPGTRVIDFSAEASDIAGVDRGVAVIVVEDTIQCCGDVVMLSRQLILEPPLAQIPHRSLGRTISASRADSSWPSAAIQHQQQGPSPYLALYSSPFHPIDQTPRSQTRSQG